MYRKTLMKFVFRNLKEINHNEDILYSMVYDLNIKKELLEKIKLKDSISGQQISNIITEYMNGDGQKLIKIDNNIITLRDIVKKYNNWYFMEYSK